MCGRIFGQDMPGSKSSKPIPKLESEDEEREFWATHDSVDYVDWSRAQRISFPHLRPSMRTRPQLPPL
ncbi:MAG TPA: CopG family antitoxin [Thermoanaerobaculia bacterium]